MGRWLVLWVSHAPVPRGESQRSHVLVVFLYIYVKPFNAKRHFWQGNTCREGCVTCGRPRSLPFQEGRSFPQYVGVSPIFYCMSTIFDAERSRSSRFPQPRLLCQGAEPHRSPIRGVSSVFGVVTHMGRCMF